MIARATLPLRYRLFNLKWGSPSGRISRKFLPRDMRLTWAGARLGGCFSFQVNNKTRAFEYPWAFDALQLKPGLRILEIGGGLSGLQFVLDRAGCSVVNVDRGMDLFNTAWPVSTDTMARLNQVLGTSVELKNQYLEEAGYAENSFDRVLSVSVFEHLPESALASLLPEVRRVLKPGGLLVMTVDLFLDVQPFAALVSNVYGTNVSVKSLVEASGLELVHGDRSELFGFEEFDWRRIAARRGELLVGQYPAMVQTVVLRKPTASAR